MVVVALLRPDRGKKARVDADAEVEVEVEVEVKVEVEVEVDAAFLPRTALWSETRQKNLKIAIFMVDAELCMSQRVIVYRSVVLCVKRIKGNGCWYCT
jgi:hypothetical protein